MLFRSALACAAGASMVGGMLALWMRFREVAINGPDHRWLPKGITIPEVPSNVMLIAMLPICVFAQWAVYSAKRNDRPHAGLALGLVGLLGIAFINAQAFIWATMGLPIADGSYSVLFYAVTGVMTVLAVIGVTFSVVTAFRYLGGRTADRDDGIGLRRQDGLHQVGQLLRRPDPAVEHEVAAFPESKARQFPEDDVARHLFRDSRRGDVGETIHLLTRARDLGQRQSRSQ